MSILAVGLAQRLMTRPGVGPVTALAFTLTMGPPERFQRGKQVASYLVDSQRAFQRRAPATAGAHQQTTQPVSARHAGGSGAECGAA